MNAESGFLGTKKSSIDANESDGFSDFQTLSVSATGFFKVMVGKRLGRRIIVKTLKEEAANNPVAIAQLKKEFNTLFPLDSPYIARAFRLTSTANGTPAIEMEWCGGQDVRTLMAAGLSGEDTVEIISGVLSGLKDIHMAGVIHRDIKPENVIYDPFRKVVKIIDFGCAYVTGGVVLQGPNGTVGYTPTEKMADGTEPEPKDDLYALGVMVGEMAENFSGQSSGEIVLWKKIRRFSGKLTDGHYDKAEAAAEDFKKLLKERGKFRRTIIIGVSTVTMLGVSVLAFLHFQNRESGQEAVSRTVTSVLPHSGYSTTMTEGRDDQNPSQLAQAPEGREALNEMPATRESDASTRERMDVSPKRSTAEYLNPYSEVSAEYEDAYELAYAPGPMLDRAKSKNASQELKMDAFVITYTDSIYQADGLWGKYPKNIEEDGARELAARLAKNYRQKMEQAFRKRFGALGDPGRREALLEGRFYCVLRVYHRNH